MNFRFTVILLLLLPQLVSAKPPLLPGQALYKKNCARCHGDDGTLGVNGAHNLTLSNLNTMGRTYLVVNGMGRMPAFGKTLTPEQVQQVVAYSLTLK